MSKLVWRVKLVAERQPGVTTKTKLACIERDAQAGLADLGLSLAEPIATSFVESAVDEIISWRMAKAQQMRWNRTTVQPFVDVRTAVLNDTPRMPSAAVTQAFDPPTTIGRQ